MTINAIIVDDEPLARGLVREYLASHSGIEVVAECGDGATAIASINSLRPDLVFLDVQMPECDGFAVLRQLHDIPAVVFSTAHEKYALKAFEVSAVDYLLKPYARERFDEAVRRCARVIAGKEDTSEKMIRLMEVIQERRDFAPVLFVKLRGRIVPVTVADIVWIRADGDYAEVHTQGRSYHAGQSLAHLGTRLDPRAFGRIHRSSIVNVAFIDEITRTESGGYTVRLKTGEQLPVGRAHVDALKGWMV